MAQKKIKGKVVNKHNCRWFNYMNFNARSLSSLEAKKEKLQATIWQERDSEPREIQLFL